MVRQYLEHSKKILSSPNSKFKFNERRGLGRIYIFGHQNRYDLQEGFPLLTTKKMGFKTLAHELIWFFSGETNIKYLADNNVHIWDDDTFNHNLKGMVDEGIFPRVFPKYSEEWIAMRDDYIQRVKEDSEFSLSLFSRPSIKLYFLFNSKILTAEIIISVKICLIL